MKFLIALILASLCTGCMFEAQRALGCNNVGIFGCKDKVQPPNTDGPFPRKAGGQPSETVCLPEQREVDACIEIYQPVCATLIVQCDTTSCDPVQETFANSCKACMNALVRTHTKGECPVK